MHASPGRFSAVRSGLGRRLSVARLVARGIWEEADLARLKLVHFGGSIFQQAEKPFRWFVNLVRKSFDKLPDASVDRFRMKGVI